MTTETRKLIKKIALLVIFGVGFLIGIGLPAWMSTVIASIAIIVIILSAFKYLWLLGYKKSSEECEDGHPECKKKMNLREFFKELSGQVDKE